MFRRKFHRSFIKKEDLYGIFFVIPALITIIGVIGYPWLYALYYSFHDLILYRPTKVPFVGLQHYMFWQDEMTITAVKNTLIYAGICIFFQFLLGMGIALLLSKEMSRKRLLRTLCILPMMITPTVVGLMWRYMFNEKYGIINYFLDIVGLPEYIWLGTPAMAMPSIIIVEIWEYTPFVTLMMLAGLQAIPQQLYEAAKIDGASSFQVFISIIFPLLKPVIIIALFFRVMFVLRNFPVPYILLGGSGGPGNAALLLPIQLYRTAFKLWEMGKASALSYLLLLITIICCGYFIKNIINYQVKSLRR